MIFTLIFNALGAVSDVQSRVIPDWISLSYLAVSIAFSLVQRGIPATLVLLVLLFASSEIMFRIGGFGGGDLKLMSGVILIHGREGLWMIYWGLVISLIIYAGMAIQRRTTKVSVPYALALLLGILVYGAYDFLNTIA